VSQRRRYGGSRRSKPLVLVPKTGDLRRSGNQLVVKVLQLGGRSITYPPPSTDRGFARSEGVAHGDSAVFAKVMAPAGSNTGQARSPGYADRTVTSEPLATPRPGTHGLTAHDLRVDV
jgi:hypothetical protein